jgi:hypothetical protein
MKATIYTSILASSVALLFTSCLKDYDNPSKGTPADKTYIYALRNAYRGSEITLSSKELAGASFIQGVVISDKTAQNIEPGSFVIQQTVVTGNQVGDITRGVVIKMATGNADYNLGDSLVINVIGGRLDRISGKLTVSGLSTDKITKIAENRTPLVRPVTLSMLNAMMEDFESTLIAVHADVADYGAGVTYSGERKLSDNTGPQLYLRTRNEATFAANAVAVDAQFNGIAGYHNESGKDTAGAKKTIFLRNATDIKFQSGALYAGFPESFETPDISEKASYNITATQNNIDLSTGNWKLQQAILANTLIRDKYNLPGAQCVRMQQNLSTPALVQMNFDLTQGASKVTVFYGKYYTDPTSTFRLEYSINGGTNWIALPPDIKDMPERGSKQATFTMNLTGNVRFRINKLGLGSSSSTVQNGRLCIEDIAIYKAL